MSVRFIGFVLILLALALAPAHAQEANDDRDDSVAGLSLADIARMVQVGEVVVSPDGRRIAYTRIVPRDLEREEDGAAWTELHIIGANGVSRPFVAGQVNVASLGWTPDSSSVLFLSRRADDSQRQLYSISATGGEARRLTKLASGVAGYSISPDGNRLALVATEPLSSSRRREQDLGFDQIIFEEDWLPRRLWIQAINQDGEPPEAEALDIEGSVQSALWSPAGDRLAVVVTPRQLVDDTLMFQRIRILRPDGAEIGRIDNPGKLGRMAWSPDGQYLAFIATDTIHDPREGRLMVSGRDGGNFRNLLPELEGHVWHVDWRDRAEIVFISYEGVEARVGQIEAQGRNEMTLVQRDGVIFDGLSVAGNGRLVFSASTPEHPREVFSLSARNLELERLTDSNPWLGELRMARQEVVVYPAQDGTRIEGLLIWPLDFEEGQRYPLILAVHGGPEAHYSNGWLTTYNLPGQHMAAEGYFVFYQNYRGSTGRGVAFTKAGQARPAMEEFQDLIDGIDFLVARGQVDAERVGITGGSYGGYASAWGATYFSERFAAAVMNVGISDKISMLGTSDIPQELYLVHYRYWPWDNWDLYKQASPIFYVHRAQTPILILHGDADPRVDPTQSKILYRYLVLQENPPPVRLVLYRGEGHGNQRAATRWDYSLRLMQWMDHYLKGEGGAMPDLQLDYGLERLRDE